MCVLCNGRLAFYGVYSGSGVRGAKRTVLHQQDPGHMLCDPLFQGRPDRGMMFVRKERVQQSIEYCQPASIYDLN